jgi:hypothetical protein
MVKKTNRKENKNKKKEKKKMKILAKNKKIQNILIFQYFEILEDQKKSLKQRIRNHLTK